MSESPVERLHHWEASGGTARVVRLGDGEAVVDLCACTGEPMERLTSGDADLIALLSERTGEN
jgi:hypothetical protein